MPSCRSCQDQHRHPARALFLARNNRSFVFARLPLLSRRLSESLLRVISTTAPRICTEVRVMFFDTDCAGVVHNIVYLRFIETARTLLAEQLGMGLVEMASSQNFPVVVRTEIDYRRPARLGDRLVVHGWLESVERLRFWCGFEVRRPADGAIIA